MARAHRRQPPARVAAAVAPETPIGVGRSVDGGVYYLPPVNYGPNAKDPGGYGVDQPLESTADLQWPQSVDTYARMRHDPAITSALAAYVNPIRRARWAVDPRGADPVTARIVADSLNLPVTGDPEGPGPARRRGVQFIDHAVLAGTLVQVYGHAPFEPWYEVRDGVVHLKDLGARVPTSLRQILTARDGSLIGVRQKGTYYEGRTDREPLIPGDRLLWYVRGKEGANWQGVSGIRHAFGAWLIKQDMMRVQGTGIRRFGAPTPVMEPQPGFVPTDAQRAAALAAAAAVRVGETGGLAPHGYTLKLVGVTGTLPDALPYLQWLDQQIARGSLTSFLDLGNTGSGNRAMAATFVEVLNSAVDAFAQSIAQTATEIAVKLTDFNAGEDAASPAITVDITQTDVAVMAAEMVSQGALVLDDSLEDWIRDTLRLPTRRVDVNPAPGTADDQAAPATEPVTFPRSATRTASGRKIAAAGKYSRDLTPLEQASGLDPAALDAAHDEIMAALMDAWPEISDAWAEQIVSQVAAADDVTGLTGMSLDPGDAAALVAAALDDAWAAGTATAAAEAERAGAVVVAPPSGPDWSLVAAGVVTVLASGLVNAAAREAVRVVSADGTGLVTAAAHVRDHLAALSGVYPQDILGGAVADGMNAGRRDTFTTAPSDEWTLAASEVRDRATCAACRAVDGHVYADIDEAAADYPTGGYALCAGRERCRGVLVLVPRSEYIGG